jgi:hypothetical protein
VIAASAPRRVRLDWRFITGAVACFVLLVVGISIVVQSFAPTGNAPVVDDLVRISPVVGPAITTPTPTPTLERPRPTAQVPSEPPVSVVPRVPR